MSIVPPRLNNDRRSSRREPVPLTSKVPALFSPAAVKAKKDLSPRRKSSLISLGQFAHNSPTFEDPNPRSLASGSAWQASQQPTESEAAQSRLWLGSFKSIPG